MRRLIPCMLLWCGVLLVTPQTLSAASISSGFDADLEGWTGSEGGAVTYNATGGNPGGFLQQTDVDLSDMYVIAPAAYLGDRTSYIGGTLSFDAIQLIGPGDDYDLFGTVTLRSGGSFVIADLALPGNPPRDWASYSITLDGASFGATELDFAAILSNLTAIEVMLESQIGVIESTGFDNFKISTAVPEVSSFVLLGVLLPAAFIVRGRGKKSCSLGL